MYDVIGEPCVSHDMCKVGVIRACDVIPRKTNNISEQRKTEPQCVDKLKCVAKSQCEHISSSSNAMQCISCLGCVQADYSVSLERCAEVVPCMCVRHCNSNVLCEDVSQFVENPPVLSVMSESNDELLVNGESGSCDCQFCNVDGTLVSQLFEREA